MYRFEEYSDDDEGQNLRDQEGQSLYAVNETLRTSPTQVSSTVTNETKQKLSSAVHPRTLTWHDSQPQLVCAQTSNEQARSAAKALQQLLEKTKMPAVQENRPEQLKLEAPNAEEVSSLLLKHTTYAQQLESENRYLREELAVLHLKLSELVDENRRLHAELKTTVVHEILQEGGDMVKLMGSLEEGSSELVKTVMNRQDFKRWQVELERLSRLHSAKAERLEAQLEYSKSEVRRLEQTVEDLKSQLRMQDYVPTHDNNFGDASLLSHAARSNLQIIIDRLTKERDELYDRISGLTAQNHTLSQREEELYEQVKRSIALVEQAQLEQTEALVQKEQLAEELIKMRERFEQHVRTSLATTQQEREAIRQESQFLISDLNKKLTEQTSHLVVITERLEKEEREKAELSAQLLEVKGELRACDREVSMATENFKAQTTSTTLHRSSAAQEVECLRMEYQQLQREGNQKCKILLSEVAELKRRLNSAERDLLNAKEECLLLTTNMQSLERELHLAKLTREGIERSRAEDLKLITRQASEQEQKLRAVIDDAEDKHAHQMLEMDSMLHRQNKLILKLRDECKRQAEQLEKLTKKYRVHNKQLKTESEATSQRLERTLAHLNILEEQADQHSNVHNKMAARLKAMDEHAQNQSTQLIEILAVNTRLSRDRQLLAKEVEFLRAQLSRINTIEIIRSNSSSKPLVDDILNSLTKEERNGTSIPTLRVDLTKTAADLEEEVKDRNT